MAGTAAVGDPVELIPAESMLCWYAKARPELNPLDAQRSTLETLLEVGARIAAGPLDSGTQLSVRMAEMLGLMIRYPHAIALIDVRAKPTRTDPAGRRVDRLCLAAVVQTGDQAEAFLRIIQKAVNEQTNAGQATLTVQQAGRWSYQELRDQRLPEWATIAWGQIQGHFVLTVGPEVWPRIAAVAAGQERPITQDPWYAAARAGNRQATWIEVFLSARAIQERLDPFVSGRASEFFRAWEVDELNQAHWALGYQGRALYCLAHLRVGQETVERVYADPDHADPALLAVVPPGARYAIFDLPAESFLTRLFRGWLAIQGARARANIERLWAEAQAQWGFDAQRDLLAHLGQHVILHNDPPHPLHLPLAFTSLIEIRDQPAAVRRTLGTICSAWQATLDQVAVKGGAPPPFTLRQDSDGIWYVRFSLAGPSWLGLAGPAWTVTDRFIILSWSPTALREYLDKLPPEMRRTTAGDSQAASGSGQARLLCTVSIRSPEQPRAAVALDLRGIDPACASVRWRMAKDFAFVRLAEPLIEAVRATTLEGQPLTCHRPQPYEWEVATAGVSAMRVTYEVPLRHRELEAVRQRDSYEYPYLASDHGLLSGAVLFMCPQEVPIGRLRVRFDLPPGWPVYAAWRATGPAEFELWSCQDLLYDFVAIGHWRVREFAVGEFQGVVAFAPGQDVLEELATDPIRRIVEYELELFGRRPEGRYLFVFGRPEAPGLAGSPKTNSMTLSVESGLIPVAGSYLPHLIAHEFFHTWSSGIELPDELRWVGEGFTDYYAYLIPARLGLVTWDMFAAELGRKMQSAATNPGRGRLSLVQAGGPLFFEDRDAYQLVYDGGSLVAAWLDQVLRSESHKTLDDLMRALLNDACRRGRPAGPRLQDLLERVRELAGESVAARLHKLVTEPYDFDPVAALAEVGIQVRREACPPELDLRANLDGTRLLDIDPGGLAYRVGLRAGDELLEVNGQAVGNAAEVRKAWRSPADQRARVSLRREGQIVRLDAPLEPVTVFAVPPDPWRGATSRPSPD